MKFGVLGAGAWGTALAIRLARTRPVTLWTRSPRHADDLRTRRENRRYLPGHPFPASLQTTAQLDRAIADADCLICAVPSNALRELAQTLRQRAPTQPLIWLCKGFESNSRLLPHQVLDTAWPEHPAAAVLSGPSFAQEVARDLPAALTVACPDLAFARTMARAMHDPGFRLYASTDVVGVELGGALKNVIAIAAGISDGLGFGLNARAALLTRGLAELSRLGRCLGGRAETFMGLSGMGDLILTCTGDLSRNRQLGLRLAAGEHLEAALQSLGHVAEGVPTAMEADQLAKELDVDTPITQAVAQILRQETPPHEAVGGLLSRNLKDEGL
ncbi:MAG TPA: NAD(P)H-dependent glycerol-3-phosphate dehydrogenase [Thiobacillaceae bacterium]|nr:NAD(P)H-dependent glycerol-3-phosphate dehydrogenase [Thiobacillaceae bacterium]HNU64562.1 NAD(P)H-dependent glycerol-3-phosphate dehydrogenase [Thiobacillaceae bacterium]